MGLGYRFAAMVAVVVLSGCQSDARMRWDHIGPGPTLEYAQAQCNILAMGVGQSTIAIGSPAFVAGAGIGDAIGTAIQQQQFRKNCMVMQGWKQVPDVRGAAPAKQTATTPTAPRKRYALTAAQQRAVKQQVAAQLAKPGEAIFGNMGAAVADSGAIVVCGTVNPKSPTGYAGLTPYAGVLANSKTFVLAGIGGVNATPEAVISRCQQEGVGL